MQDILDYQAEVLPSRCPAQMLMGQYQPSEDQLLPQLAYGEQEMRFKHRSLCCSDFEGLYTFAAETCYSGMTQCCHLPGLIHQRTDSILWSCILSL